MSKFIGELHRQMCRESNHHIALPTEVVTMVHPSLELPLHCG